MTPLSVPMGDAVFPPPESLSIKKPCRKIPAPQSEAVDDSIPEYSDIPLVGLTRPELIKVLPWVRFEAQSMCESPWRTELSQIQKDEEVWYITAMAMATAASKRV